MTISYCTTCELWRGVNKDCPSCKRPCEQKEVPNRRGGYYYIGGVDRPLPSVTHIMDVLAKPGLDFWKRKLVAAAALENPLISIEEACKAPDKVRDKAGNKGGDIHNIIEHAAQGELPDPENFSDPWKQHIVAYLKFVKEMPHKILEAEKEVYSKKNGYAGKLDAVVQIGDRKFLVDYKTNKALYVKDHALQLGAYKLALEEMGTPVDACAIVHLKVDGTYSFVEVTPEPRAFLACLFLFNYINND